MSTMTSTYDETVVERRDVLPQLKFLWEVYRCVLDIIRTSTKLEEVRRWSEATAKHYTTVLPKLTTPSTRRFAPRPAPLFTALP